MGETEAEHRLVSVELVDFGDPFYTVTCSCGETWPEWTEDAARKQHRKHSQPPGPAKNPAVVPVPA